MSDEQFPFQMMITAFSAQLVLGDELSLTPQRAFVCLSLFGLLRYPCLALPHAIVSISTVSCFSGVLFVVDRKAMCVVCCRRSRL